MEVTTVNPTVGGRESRSKETERSVIIPDRLEVENDILDLDDVPIGAPSVPFAFNESAPYGGSVRFCHSTKSTASKDEFMPSWGPTYPGNYQFFDGAGMELRSEVFGDFAMTSSCCKKNFWGDAGIRMFGGDGTRLMETHVHTHIGRDRGMAEMEALAGLKHFVGQNRFVVAVTGSSGTLVGRGTCCCATLPSGGFLGARDASGNLRFVLKMPAARNCCHALCQMFGKTLCLPCFALAACCQICGLVCKRCINSCDCCCGKKVLHTMTKEYPRQIIRMMPVMDASGESIVAYIVLQGAVDMTNRLTGYTVHVQTPAGMGYEDANLIVMLAYFFDAKLWAMFGPDGEIDAMSFNIGIGEKKA